MQAQNIKPMNPQFDTTVWDRMDKSLTETAAALEKGSAALKAKAGAVDAKQLQVLASASENWSDVGDFAWMGAIMTGAAAHDAFAGTVDRAAQAGNLVKGAGKHGVAAAGWTLEGLVGEIKEVYTSVCLRLNSAFGKIADKFLNRASNVAKVKLERADTNQAERRAAVLEALAQGLADHTWSKALFMDGKEDFKVAAQRGREAAEHYAWAGAELMAAGVAAGGVMWHVGGTCVDLAHAAALEGKELAYEAAALGQRAARVGVLAAKRGAAKGAAAEVAVDTFVGRAMEKASEAMLMSAERTAEIDPKSIAALKAEVIKLESDFAQAAA
jgi:hypothetical protein